jgi:PKHD-type hydroxylase
MLMQIAAVIVPADLAPIRQRFDALSFVEGTRTAGWHAKLVKNNLQADRQDPGYAALNQTVTDAIMRNMTFRLAAKPKTITLLLFSRYSDGMAYGAHIDDAVMMNLRSDISFTLALSDPSDYDGGELVMETPGGEQDFKLPAGHMIIYPSTTLHRVQPVTRGERKSAVGWIQSQVRHAHHREMLYDLEIARRSMFEKTGKSRDFDLITKVAANLAREWTEI